MDRRALSTGLYSGMLFTVLGVGAWLSGQPLIFPSLGPTAYVLAFARRGERTRTYRIVGSHVIGVAAGLLAYHSLAEGVVLTEPIPPGSFEGFRLAASGVSSVVVTSWLMIAFDARHAPACATTLIVSLGLLTTRREVAAIVVSVVVLVGVHRASLRLYGGLGRLRRETR